MYHLRPTLLVSSIPRMKKKMSRQYSVCSEQCALREHRRPQPRLRYCCSVQNQVFSRPSRTHVLFAGPCDNVSPATRVGAPPKCAPLTLNAFCSPEGSDNDTICRHVSIQPCSCANRHTSTNDCLTSSHHGELKKWPSASWNGTSSPFSSVTLALKYK